MAGKADTRGHASCRALPLVTNDKVSARICLCLGASRTAGRVGK